MRRTASALIALALLAPALTAAQGAAPPAEPPPGQEPPAGIMPVSEIRSGMTGYGLTALKGTRPERFDIEVLGVLKGWFAKGDLILVRMSGPGIDEAGIISGMSGSPLYIDDRLIGAVAYGWSYSKIPVAGVTPAADMLALNRIGTAEAAGEDRVAAKARARYEWRQRTQRLARLMTSPERSAESLPAIRAAAARLALPSSRPERLAGWTPDGLPASVRGMLPQGADLQMRPLPLPVAVGGPASAGALTSLLAGSGFMPVQALAPGGAAADLPDVKIEPGIPVGVAFISGDIDLAGMGTLTIVEGDRVLAFGHSMYSSGETDLPMVVGHVQAVVPSVSTSFKIAVSGKVIGSVVQDRESAIMGVLGREAPTFRCKVRVRGAVDDEYNYRVAGHWEQAPTFGYMAVAASSARWEGEGTRYSLTAGATIRLKDVAEPIVLRNIYNSYSAMSPGTDLVARPLQTLLMNPFREVEIESVDYDLEVRRGFQAAAIESAWVDRVAAEPGSDVTVYVRMLTYRGETVLKKLPLHIPETARPGTEVQVLLADAMSNRMVRMTMDPAFYAPRSFEALLASIKRMEPNTNLVMRASFFERGLRYAGGAMPALPPSALTVLQHNRMGGQTGPLVTDVEQSFEMPWVVEGSQSVTITVKERDPFNP